MLKRPAPVTIHDGELTETKVVRAVLISKVGAGADATAGKRATAAATLGTATTEAAVHGMAETTQVGRRPGQLPQPGGYGTVIIGPLWYFSNAGTLRSSTSATPPSLVTSLYSSTRPRLHISKSNPLASLVALWYFSTGRTSRGSSPWNAPASLSTGDKTAIERALSKCKLPILPFVA